MTRPTTAAVVVTIAGVAGVGVWSMQVERAGVTASLWFDGVEPDGRVEFVRRARGRMTEAELTDIEGLAQQELQHAFAMTCIQLSSSPNARYRVRVRLELVGLIAGHSRSLPGLRGDGAISFAAITSNAVAFAPDHADRGAIVEAMGRGIGRTAAHELAHQLLGGLQLHDPRDRLSYEYPDLRPEHFYAPLHWGIALAPLQSRYGAGANGCTGSHE